MSGPRVYVALQQFCERDERPRHLLIEAGCAVRQNTVGRRLRREDMREVLRDADAVLAGIEPYDAELLASLPRLRCISRCGVGTDAIDLAAARHHHIDVYTTPEEVVEPVAQIAVGMILALARNIPLHLRDAHAGIWKKHTGVLLSEWTIGLVGFGRIGRMVERYLRAFGSRVLVHDPRCSPRDMPDGVEPRSLPSLLADADLVSMHAGRGSADATPSPGGGDGERERAGGGPVRQDVLIGRDELALMKRGGYLVNTARGFLVDEVALHEALSGGHLAGAALDVFQDEPYTGPLAQLPNVLCTPHVATLTRASRAQMELRAARQIVDRLARVHAEKMTTVVSEQ